MVLLSGGICGLLVLALIPLQSRADVDEARAKESCNGGDHGIPCCPEYVNGDGYGGSEIEITGTFSPKTEAGCQNSCKVQHPSSIAATQTHDGTSRCFCEFGTLKLGGNKNSWKTCAFKQSCLLEDNIDYRWHDVDYSKVDGAKSCAEKCLKNDRCRFWTLGNSEHCYMKSSNANKVVQKGSISGNKVCGKTGGIVNGGWSDWSEWGTCVCGNNIATNKIQIRTRTCSKPEKTFGGKDCFGSSQDTRDCNMGGCPACYYLPLGCWKDKQSDRTMPSLEGTDYRLNAKNKRGTFRPIDVCFQVAASKGFPAFSIQDSTKGTCMGGPNALDTYNKHGCAEDGCKQCWLGLGGHNKNDVYQIICDDINVIKQDFMALENNGSKQYQDAARAMLPALLKADAIEENEIGVASEVTDPTDTKHSYPWSLLTGDDIIKTRVPEKLVRINGTVIKNVGQRVYSDARRRTTGMYAEAGTIVTIDIPQKLVGKLDVFIGPFIWDRKYTYRYRMEKSTQKIGSPWGGVISIFLFDIDATTAYGGDGMFDVRIQNAVQAPYFVYGENTNEEWNNSIKKQAAPYAILLVPGQVQIYIQTYLLKRVTDIEKVVEGWKKSYDIADDLLGIPVGLRPGEEQIHMYPGGGCWRAGNCNEGGGSNFCGLAESEKDPNWKFSDNSGGVYHEMGHGYCFPDLPSASSQMWAELIREYIERTKGNIPLSKQQKTMDDTFYLLFRMVSYSKYSKGKSCGRESLSKDEKRSYKTGGYNNCWYFVYRLPLHEFGWNVFKKMMNLDAIATKSYKSREERLVDLYCKATGRNLIPMFHFYNIRVSESIEESCKKQQLPDLITKYLSIATCLLDDTKEDKECSKLPGFPPHNGLCTLTGVCSMNRDFNRQVIMNNEFDLWGSISGNTGDFNRKESYQQYKNTSMVKENCLGRAREMFVWCDNTQEAQSITATFISNDGTSQSSIAGPPEGNCYYDSPRLMPDYKASTSTMVPEECNLKCKQADKSYSYFGVQYYNECWCGHEAPPLSKRLYPEECDTMCKGDEKLRCGGGYKANIWKICSDENCEFKYD